MKYQLLIVEGRAMIMLQTCQVYTIAHQTYMYQHHQPVRSRVRIKLCFGSHFL